MGTALCDREGAMQGIGNEAKRARANRRRERIIILQVARDDDADIKPDTMA